MPHRWGLLRPDPTHLFHPVAVDPEGRRGPTRQQARSRRWRRTSHGLYVPAYVDSTNPEQRVAEVAARLPAGAAVTSWASLLMHGGNHFDGLGPRMEELPVPVSLPLPGDVSRSPHLLKLRAPLHAGEIVVRHGVCVTEPNRALMDLMTRATDWRTAAIHASVACSAGLVDLQEFRRYVARRRCISGIVKVRKALEYADDRVRSPREAKLFQVWCVEAELPRPLMNWPVFDANGSYVGTPDVLSPELGVYGEYDGADHEESGARDVDADRDSRFRAVGLTGFRLGKATFGSPRRRVERILQSVAAAEMSRLPRTFILGVDPEPVVARDRRRLASEAVSDSAY